MILALRKAAVTLAYLIFDIKMLLLSAVMIGVPPIRTGSSHRS